MSQPLSQTFLERLNIVLEEQALSTAPSAKEALRSLQLLNQCSQSPANFEVLISGEHSKTQVSFQAEELSQALLLSEAKFARKQGFGTEGLHYQVTLHFAQDAITVPEAAWTPDSTLSTEDLQQLLV